MSRRTFVRVSELVAASGVPLATVKYYLREGLLMPGESTSATRADYTDLHLRRLTLIKALAGIGLPLPKIRVIVELIDEPRESLFDTLGHALAALPPYLEPVREGYPRAKAALDRLGQIYDPDYPAVAQLEHALAAAEDVGIPMSDERLRSYGEHVLAIARIDLASMPARSPESTVEYAVLGTAIYEPVLAALRRLAHQHLMATMLLDPDADPDADERAHDR